MNTIKASVLSLLLGATVADQLMPEAMPELFKLEEDNLIINPTGETTASLSDEPLTIQEAETSPFIEPSVESSDIGATSSN